MGSGAPGLEVGFRRIRLGLSVFVHSVAIPLPSSKRKMMWHFSSCWGFYLLCKSSFVSLKQNFKTIGPVFVLPYVSKMFTLCLYVLHSVFDKQTIKPEVNISVFKIPLVN